MTRILDAITDPEAAVRAAVDALRVGDIVGLPTDTVYGLAADPWHTGASDRLFLVKGRPRNVELPVLVADRDQALALVTAVPDGARRLIDELWPGPLTLVLPRAPGVDADLGEEDETIGIRCPDHPIPRAVCAQIGPIATTSANRHGESPAVTAPGCAFPGVAVVLDAGICNQPASTVVDCTGGRPRLLRAGSIPWARIEAIGG
jgi:L-threonylcarbamoyladenylate synthase